MSESKLVQELRSQIDGLEKKCKVIERKNQEMHAWRRPLMKWLEDQEYHSDTPEKTILHKLERYACYRFITPIAEIYVTEVTGKEAIAVVVRHHRRWYIGGCHHPNAPGWDVMSGMSKEEFDLWVESNSNIDLIVERRREKNRPFEHD